MDSRMDRHDPFGLKKAGIPVHSAQAAEDLSRWIAGINQEVENVKGIGTTRIVSDNQILSSRLAWAADERGRIRLEMIGPSGHPLARLAADGRAVYFYSLAENRFYQTRFTDRVLNNYLDIPFDLNQMTDVLCGRIPVPDHDGAALVDNLENGGYILYLALFRSREVVRIFLHSDMKIIWKMERLKPDGALVYRMHLDQYRQVENSMIPFFINVVNDSGSSFQLETDRVWINTTMDDDMFILTRPE
jgi:hypothetical protein